MGERGGVDPGAPSGFFFATPSLAIIGVGTPLAGSECIGGEVASLVGHRATATDAFAIDAIPPMLLFAAAFPTCGGVDAGRAGAGAEAPSLAIATASGVRWIGFAASPASVVSLPESEGDGARRSGPGVVSAGWRILPGAGCGTARRSSATATVMARGPSADEDGRGCEMPEVS